MKHIHRRKQRGFLGIELNAVLVVTAVLGGAALVAGISYINTAKSDALFSGHTLIIEGVRKAYRNAEDFSGLSTARVVSLKALPRSWIRGSAIENNMGGSVQVSAATVTNANDALQISHGELDESECNGFVNKIWPEAITISVGGSSVKSQGDVNLDVGSLATACDNASNTVASVYSKF